MSASCALNGKYIPYAILLMAVIMGMLFLMLGIAVNPNIESILLSFLLIFLIAVIVIVAVWAQKISFKPENHGDHSLKK